MAHPKHWSDSQILEVFVSLGIKHPEHKDHASAKLVNKTPDKRIYLPRLSNSSVPPPTGRNKNAKLENTSKRG
jgi:hypothetical protein